MARPVLANVRTFVRTGCLLAFLLIAAGIFLIPRFAQAQESTYTIRGSVVDSSSGDRLPYATVRVQRTFIGTYTSGQGYFVLPRIPSGDRRIVVSAVGYREHVFEIESGSPVVNVTFQLAEEPTTLAPVEVNGEFEGQMRPVEPSTTVLYGRDLQRAAGLFSNDAVQAVTQLPGIVTVGGVSSQYYVRGGASDQNLVTIDGIRIYNLFHAFGLFSFIDPLIVKVADMSTGGFQAQYGGRLSSVLSIETKDGDMRNYNAAGSFDLLSSDVMFSGPVPLNIMGDHTSFIGFFRTSLYKNSLRRYFDRTMPFEFFDGFGKITSDFTSTGHLSFEFLTTGDQIWSENQVDPDYNWRDAGYSLSGNYLFSDQYSFRFSVSSSVYNAEQIPRASSYLHYESDQILDPAFYGDLTYYGSSTTRLDFGLLFNFPSYNFTFTNAFGNPLNISDQETEPNFWARYKWEVIENLDLELGLRFDLSRTFQYATGSGKGYIADPRATLTYHPSDNAILYFATGQYHQRIISLNNEDDIYTPFDLIVPIPEDNTNLEDEEAYHFILGGQYLPTNVLRTKAEIYYKDFTRLVTINRNKIDASDPDFIMGTGRSYGLELSSEYDIGSFYLTANYTYGRVTNTSDGFTFAPRYDRRHQANLSAGWQPFDGFWLRMHWEYGSGLPYTPLAGFYPQLLLDPNNLQGYKNAAASNQIVFGQKDAARMPAYHRLDVSASYEMNILGMNWTSELMLINIYNRKNVFYINNVSGDVEYSLPFIVNLSLSWRLP
ncbi:MAG: TonB-dependent receptor [Bacteroidetes bacterium]|nr:TonB-dependent receptor [Bacteroidota bacterium]